MRTDKPTPIADTLFKLSDTLEKRKKFIKNEFQAYGLELAKELGDWKNRSLYIRLAKNTPRDILEKAYYFVKDQPRLTVKSKPRLFMWKLKELKTPKIS
jgi:hypothetical protein